ncbi:hypothetical protein [Olleya namhaensis]|uniref:hypothetical protein n=1 Tax=Olleya namhaensis TaxID=1144750 RepID=UPI0011602B62|nr:hypothetical protein [Olleya namhaensis]
MKSDNIRNLKLKSYQNIRDFKIELLEKLKLYNRKKDCTNEFYEILENYLNRNRGTKFEIAINKTKLSEKIYTRNLRELTKQDIPKNYPHNASNMEKQAYYNQISGEKYALCEKQAKTQTEKEFNDFIKELDKINGFENFEIVLEK